MPKGSHSISILQGKEKVCYITGATTGLQKHHCFRASRRAKADKHGLWVWLTAEYHVLAPYAVHNKDGKQLYRQLQRECQRAYLESHSMEEWMELMGKNYLNEVIF